MRLNRNQKLIVGAWMTLITLSFLFPCWQYDGINREYEDMSADYRFILRQPVHEGMGDELLEIDYKRLLTQIFVISLIAFGGIFVTSNNRKSNEDSTITKKI